MKNKSINFVNFNEQNNEIKNTKKPIKKFWKYFLFFIFLFVIISLCFYFYKKNELNFLNKIYQNTFENKKKIINIDNKEQENINNTDYDLSDSNKEKEDEEESYQGDDADELIKNLNNNSSPSEDNDNSSESEVIKNGSISSQEAEKIIKTKANEIVLALKNKDFKKVASFVSEDEKLTFSPYCYVKKEDLSFSKSEVENLFSNKNKYSWGVYNGVSPTKIEKTFAEYYDEFIFDQDFSQAEKISYNEILGKGNMKNNIQSFFPNSIVVEYHFSGFEEELDGMDWKSLRLVFVKVGDDWFLKAIVHDAWTI